MRGDRVCFAATVFYFLILLERRKAVCRRGERCVKSMAHQQSKLPHKFVIAYQNNFKVSLNSGEKGCQQCKV